MKKKEVDLTTLYEDPYFTNMFKKTDARNRRGFRTGKASMPARVNFGKIPGDGPDDDDDEEGEAADKPQDGAPTAASSAPDVTKEAVDANAPEAVAQQVVEQKAKVRDATKGAEGDVDAAQKFFEGEKPKPKAKP